MTIEQTKCQPNAAEEADFQEAFSEDVARVVSQVEEIQRMRKNLKGKAARLESRIEQIKEDYESVDDLTATLESLYAEFDSVRDGVYEIIATALGHRYTAQEIQSWYERADEFGCASPRIGPELIEDLMYERKVPNVRFREAYLTAGPGKKKLAAELISNGDLVHLGRMVGHRIAPGSKRDRDKPTMTLYLTYENAAALAQVFGMDPRLAGI